MDPTLGSCQIYVPLKKKDTFHFAIAEGFLTPNLDLGSSAQYVKPVITNLGDAEPPVDAPIRAVVKES